ncbi:hypothetical protein WP5S18E05_44940 [Klebsiella quasipneumoniae]|nr:hypothetical protein WP5S18E05_44940 [Klebsiella quasipneumoniae]
MISSYLYIIIEIKNAFMRYRKAIITEPIALFISQTHKEPSRFT